MPATGDANASNERLVEAVRKDGRVFFSSTVVNGNYALNTSPAIQCGMIRFPLLSFRAHMNTVGYGPQAFRGSPHAGFASTMLEAGFATELAEEAPLPERCAF